MADIDPSSISPSAYALLLMKRHTAIPYVREAAALLENNMPQAHRSEPAAIPQISSDPLAAAAFLLHFESRYWSIDQLMAGLPITNILEISSGFSFRGLELSHREPVHYIDTDLPGLIAVKQVMVDALRKSEQTAADTGAPIEAQTAAGTGAPTETQTSAETRKSAEAANTRSLAAPPATIPGHYELQPLDVLDANAFAATVARFPPGPLLILNEGLIVYFDLAQKEQFCANIRNALAARGGYWITADIYMRDPGGGTQPTASKPSEWEQWKTEFNIEQKKFTDFDEARAFFTRMGFKIDKEATPDYSRLTSLPFLRTIAGPNFLEDLRQLGRPRLRTTWRLSLQS